MSAQLASPAASRRRHIHHSHSRHRTSASQAQSRLPCANDSVEAHKEVSAISSPTSRPGRLPGLHLLQVRNVCTQDDVHVLILAVDRQPVLLGHALGHCFSEN